MIDVVRRKSSYRLDPVQPRSTTYAWTSCGSRRSCSTPSFRRHRRARSTATSRRADQVIADDDAVDALAPRDRGRVPRAPRRCAARPADVRFVAATLRVAHELERTADLMVNVAKTDVAPRCPTRSTPPSRRLVDAWAARSPCSYGWRSTRSPTATFVGRGARRHGRRDRRARADRCSATCSGVERARTTPTTDRCSSGAAGAGRPSLRTVGDHTVTIAEQVPFVVTGEHRAARTSPAMARRRDLMTGERVGLGKGGFSRPHTLCRRPPGHARAREPPARPAPRWGEPTQRFGSVCPSR